MAILRAELPVTEEFLVGEGLIASRSHGRYTLLHGFNSSEGLESTRHGIGFSVELVTESSNEAQIIFRPNQSIRDDGDRQEFIIRSVAAEALEVSVARFYLPGDPEFEEVRFIIGEHDTHEVTYGVPHQPVAPLKYDRVMGAFTEAAAPTMVYLHSVLWVPDGHKKDQSARNFYDVWAE